MFTHHGVPRHPTHLRGLARLVASALAALLVGAGAIVAATPAAALYADAITQSPQNPVAANTVQTITYRCASSDDGDALWRGHWYGVGPQGGEGTATTVATTAEYTEYQFTFSSATSRTLAVLCQYGGPSGSGSGTVIEYTVATAPSEPRDVTVAPGDHSLAVTWVPPWSGGSSAATSYAVQIDSGSGWTAAGTTPSTATTIGGLINGASYQVRVAATNASGSGPWSEVVTGTPRTTPGAPIGLTAAQDQRSVHLAWAAPTTDGGAPTISFLVERSTDGSVWTTVGTTSTLEATATDLTGGTSYMFRVRANNAAGQGAPATITAVPYDIPGAPGNLTADPSDRRVQLSWSPAPDAGSPVTGYQVEQSSDGGTSWYTPPGVTTDGNSATVTGLTNGVPYTFRVAAVNAAGAGASAEVSATPRTVPGAPVSVGAEPGDRSVRLTWSPPADDGGAPVSGYLVEVSADDGATWAPVDASAVQGTTASVVDLVNSHLYRFRVAALDETGTGLWSEVTGTPFVFQPVLSGPGGQDLAGMVLHPGDTITVELSGGPVGARALLELHSEISVLADGVTGEDGTLRLRGAVPVATTPGQHEVVVRLLDAGADVEPVVVPITVAALPVDAPVTPAPVAPDDSVTPARSAPSAPAAGATRTGTSPAAPSSLSLTGSSVAPLLLGAVVLLATGAVAVRRARTRRER